MALSALVSSHVVDRSPYQQGKPIEYLERELGALEIQTWPTDANFVLAEAGEGAHEALLREGVIVRPLHGFGMPDHVRITIGLPAENERLVKAMRRIGEAAA
jgi:histidinol-phosphate aminotransferase